MLYESDQTRDVLQNQETNFQIKITVTNMDLTKMVVQRIFIFIKTLFQKLT